MKQEFVQRTTRLHMSYIWGLIGAGLVAFAVSSVHAQTAANGPYYATPSWDQTLPASTRFVVLSNMNNEAVLDRETGLVWQRAPSASGVDWDGASRMCLASTTGNRGGWRLPTVNELARLFDPTVTSGIPLPPGHPFTGLPSAELLVAKFFWTLNLLASDADEYRIIQYEAISSTRTVLVLDSSAPASFRLPRAWCVSGGLFGGPQ